MWNKRLGINYAVRKDMCYKMTTEGHQEALELQSTHEEADNRLFLHAAHYAQTGWPAVVISSDDTDVGVSY